MSLTHDLATERLVLDQFMAEPRWSRAGLKVRLEHVEPLEVDGALAGLVVAGLVIPDRRHFHRAPCLQYLAALGMLGPAAPNGHAPPKGPNRETMDRILSRTAAGGRV